MKAMWLSALGCGLLGPAIGLILYTSAVSLWFDGKLGPMVALRDIGLFLVVVFALPYFFVLVLFGPPAALIGALVASILARLKARGIRTSRLRFLSLALGTVGGTLVGALPVAVFGLRPGPPGASAIDWYTAAWLPIGTATGMMLGGLGSWWMGRASGTPADSRPPRTRWAASIMTGFCLAVLCLMLAYSWSIRTEFSRPQRFDLPDGFKGMVVVRYQVPTCPHMPDEGLYRVIVVYSSGTGCTSDPRPAGWTWHRFDYVRSDGSRASIRETGWGGGGYVWSYGGSVYHGDGTVEHRYDFFVGSEEEFRNGMKTHSR